MVAPECLYGIEIKSDADTYARLKRQVKDYDQYYDYNIVVVGSTHAMHICLLYTSYRADARHEISCRKARIFVSQSLQSGSL